MNLDFNKVFPNQQNPAERNPFECVGLSIADIVGNTTKSFFDPDFNYSLGFYLPNKIPADAGIIPYDAVLGAIAYGLLPVSAETFNAQTMGELFVANFNNYISDQKKLALQFAQNGVRFLNYFEDYPAYLQKYQQGALLTLQWYPSFSNPFNGILTEPASDEVSSSHCVAVYDVLPEGLLIKPWLGPSYGRGGYAILPKSVFEVVFEQGFGFDPKGWRWIWLVRTCLKYPQRIGELLPQVIASATIKPK